MTVPLLNDVTKKTVDFFFDQNPRCSTPGCGSTYALHLHHRVFRSEGQKGVASLLEAKLPIYNKLTGESLEAWGLHDIQNLVVVCNNCHEGPNVGIHGGNETLRQYFRNSFTCPKTGMNIPFEPKKRNSLLF